MIVDRFKTLWFSTSRKIGTVSYKGKEHLPRDLFLKYRRSLKEKSLKGDLVKSFGEKEIANFLFEHNIPYEYEKNIFLENINQKPDFSIMKNSGQKGNELTLHGEKSKNTKGLIIEYFGMQGTPKYDDQIYKKTTFWGGQKDYEMLGLFKEDIAGVTGNNYQTKIKKFLSNMVFI